MFKPVIVGIICFGVLFSCKKIQPNMSDVKIACDCAKEVSADFLMGEKYGETLIDEDTVFMPIDFVDGNPMNFDYSNYVCIYFAADIQNAISYEWQVGNNSITQSDKEFSLYFNDTIGTIQVRLIVHANPNLKCFPNDDGIDTIIKSLTIKNSKTIPMAGKYYGCNTNDPDHFFTIEIDTVTTINSIAIPAKTCNLSIYNLPEGKQKWVNLIRSIGSYSFCFNAVSDEYYQPYPANYLLYNENSNFFEKSTRGIYNRNTKEIIIDYYSVPVIDNLNLGTPFPQRRFVGKLI
jgi:hypothetical protein